MQCFSSPIVTKQCSHISLSESLLSYDISSTGSIVSSMLFRNNTFSSDTGSLPQLLQCLVYPTVSSLVYPTTGSSTGSSTGPSTGSSTGSVVSVSQSPFILICNLPPVSPDTTDTFMEHPDGGGAGVSHVGLHEFGLHDKPGILRLL